MYNKANQLTLGKILDSFIILFVDTSSMLLPLLPVQASGLSPSVKPYLMIEQRINLNDQFLVHGLNLRFSTAFNYKKENRN